MRDATMCESSWSVVYAAIRAYKAKALNKKIKINLIDCNLTSQ